MHLAGSIFINDDKPCLHKDCEEWLEKPDPHEPVSRLNNAVLHAGNMNVLQYTLISGALNGNHFK